MEDIYHLHCDPRSRRAVGYIHPARDPQQGESQNPFIVRHPAHADLQTLEEME